MKYPRKYLGLILVAVFLFQGTMSDAVVTNSANLSHAKMEQIAKQLLGNAMSGDFETSLEMREAADFLLTPALLVQEALSEKVVIGYPQE